MYLKVKVHADSKKERLLRKKPDTFEIFVSEPAKDGRANASVLKRLASELGIPAGKLWIIKGAHTPAKIIEVRP